MLYISRWTSSGEVGIVDTDDNVEELVSISELSHIVNRGVTIAGVTFLGVPEKSKILPPIRDVSVYQPDASKAQWQHRIRLLLGVDTCVYNFSLVYIGWDTQQYKAGTIFRPSQFCKSLGSYIFGFGDFRQRTKKMTLVLDDSLTVDKFTFRGVVRAKAILDLREVTKDEIVISAYSAAIASHAKTFDSFIIDSDIRRTFYEEEARRWHEEHQKRQIDVR